MKQKVKKVAIIGLGLIGGSLGMVIKNKDIAEKVVGISRSAETIEEASKKAAIDEGTTDKKFGVSDADIIFVCSPINMIIPTVLEILPYAKPGAIITDVGSTKSQIVNEIEKIIPKDVAFIGGHPMAGSERMGIASASPFLFDGAKYILTSTEKTDVRKLEFLKSFLANLDVNILILAPEIHDAIVAGISHLPIVIASALVNTIGDSKELKTEMIDLAASGFRDTTRIASGSVDMGREILMSNSAQVVKMINSFKKSLANLAKYISKKDSIKIGHELERAKRLRDSIYTG